MLTKKVKNIDKKANFFKFSRKKHKIHKNNKNFLNKSADAAEIRRKSRK